MCGICGIVDFSGAVIDEGALAAMTDAIRHRGPDDAGLEVMGPVGLGHRRLSIIDLSAAGHQPMHSDDGQATIIYNGELYNFLDLRKRLEDSGWKFRSRTDTEVILKAYLQWGTEAFKEFNGMYAAAIWDAREKRLCLVRDRFGIKPLYYSIFDGGLVFGSEIKSLLASGRVAPRMSWAALHEYLYYGNALGDRTLFDGVRKLLAGHYLVVDANGRRVAPFWRVEDLAPVRASMVCAVQEVRRRLDAAVRDHLISDVPVGVFLSGGIDSSAITALASRHYGERLRTYSVNFDFNEVNELPRAKLVADRFNTDHHELNVAANDLDVMIEAMVRCHDEPFADPADIPLYLLCRELRGDVKVILQGDGGDEIFAGYRRYNVLAHEKFWRGVSRAAAVLGSIVPGGPRRQRAMRFFETMNIDDPALRTAMLMTIETRELPPTRVLGSEARAHVERFDPFERYRDVFRRLAHLDPVQRMLYIDSIVLLPDTFLEKVDKSTMAHSIEVRVPMLDTNLTDYVMGLPSAYKVRRMQKKWIIREALRGILPNEILDGPKTGLNVPVGRWLRGPLSGYLRDVLLDACVFEDGLLDRAAVQATIDNHLSGRRNEWFLLYKLLHLVLWRQIYLAEVPRAGAAHGALAG